MKENPVLTISLLCSGREETKRCLDSLAALRKRVPCELILVDTGCGEEIKKLLYSYTDHVILFMWCDDFSKARNAGLEKAQGEWFMFLDDDEWFLDTEEIEEFFLSGEYKDYGCASYTVRNYLDKEGFTYEDSQPVRLVSLQQDIEFQGIIHEILRPLREPEKQLHSIVEHFGYVYQTPEKEKEHSERNRTLLKKALSEDKEDIRIWSHLVQEYRAAKDYETLQEFCREALEKFGSKNDAITNRERGCFYCGLVEADINLRDYEKAEKDYRKALSDERNTEYCIARLMTFGAEIFAHKGEEKLTEKCCQRYFELQEYYRTRQKELEGQDTFSVRLAFHQVVRNNMYCYQICLDMRREDTASLKRYFDDFDWDNGRVYMTEEFMPCLVKGMAVLPYEEIFVHAAEVLANKPGMDNFWEEIEKTEDEAGIRQIVRIFSQVTGGMAGEAAIKLRKMLQAEEEDDWESFRAALKEAVGICPLLGETLKRYAETYAKHRMEYHENVEIRALAARIKAQVPVLLSQGMKKEALQVLGQLQSLTPQDREIAMLKESISKGI